MRPVRIILALAVALIALSGSQRVAAQTVGLEEENKKLRADLDFARRRMVLLEEEIERLRGVVKARQEADDLAANRARRQEIEREVETLRGLKFLRPVDYHEIPRSELPAILRQKLAQQVPDQEFDRAGVALAALGVLPAGIDLKKTYLALLGEQIGAFYDQHEKGLFTFTGQPLSVSTNRVIMAHELTHALEDQHFDLSRLPIEAKGNDDRVLAATALVEGDATLVMNRYMAGDLSAATVREALGSALTTDVRQLAAAPRFLRETLLFPYLRGQEFCTALYARGGWKALAEAFQRPPASSAQVLHPELYFADPREEPLEIAFTDTVVADQKPVEDNVLGEFGARQLFLTWLHEKSRAEDAAAGWRGDRYLVFQTAAGTSYFWKVACRDRASAEAFYAAVRDANTARYNQHQLIEKKAFPVRHHDGNPTEGPTVLSTSFFATGRVFKLGVTSANEVLVIDAQDEKWSADLNEKFAPQEPFFRPVKTTRRIIYSGRVQGVGFRYSVKQIAAGFDVTGWVRNLPDGTVELLAAGETAEVEAFLDAVATGRLAGFIRQTHPQEPNPAESAGPGFEIRH